MRLITKFPKIHYCLSLILRTALEEVTPERLKIPDKWTERLPLIEKGLASLSRRDLRKFCVGWDTDATRISDKSRELEIAYFFIEDFCDNWRNDGVDNWRDALGEYYDEDE